MRRYGWWAVAALGGVAIVVLPTASGLVGHAARGFASVPLLLLYWGVGVAVLWKQPTQRAGQLLLGLGTAMAVAFAVGSVFSALQVAHGQPPWGWIQAVTLDALNWVMFLAILMLCAVFPDGEYHSGAERLIVRVAWWALPVLTVLRVVGSAEARSTNFMWAKDAMGHNSYAVPALAPIGAVATFVMKATLLVFLAAVVLLVLRFRRFQDRRRTQTLWPLAAFGATLVGFLVLAAVSAGVNNGPLWAGYLGFYIVLSLIPLSLLIGMLRYQLLDVDLVIRHSLVYGVFWVLIAAGYVAVAAALGDLAGRALPVGVAVLLTIAVTLLATPARRWLEQAADTLVFGRRVSGHEMIGQLGAVLDSTPPPDEVAAAVAETVRQGLRLQWALVSAGEDVLAISGIRPTGAEAALSVPLETRGDSIGAIQCGPKLEGRYNESDRGLVEALGRQAALAIRNARLSAEVDERLGELEASRARLVRADDDARRRLERDLHDGVQQELVAILTRMAMARHQLQRSVDLADRTLGEAQRDTRRALENLQELSRGLHPPVLTDRGLTEAVEERAALLPIPVVVRSHGLAAGVRLASDVETAAYFVVSEALTNVLKHSGAASATLTLIANEKELTIDIVDSGAGFDPYATESRGLANMRDRLDAMGGSLHIDADVGRGCRLVAKFPLGVGEHV